MFPRTHIFHNWLFIFQVDLTPVWSIGKWWHLPQRCPVTSVPMPERREYNIFTTLSNCSRRIRLRRRRVMVRPPPSSLPIPHGPVWDPAAGIRLLPWPEHPSLPPPEDRAAPLLGLVGLWMTLLTLNRGTCPPQVQEPQSQSQCNLPQLYS